MPDIFQNLENFLGEKSNCTILNLIVFKNNKQYFYNETN